MKSLFAAGLALCLAAGFTGCIVISIGNPETPPCECHPDAVDSSRGKPRQINIDFGPEAGTASKQTGAAATGKPGDYWNTVGRGFNDEHSEAGLKTATGEPTTVLVESINLGGAWGCGGELGVRSAMLDSFNYPANNKGGNSRVILHDVPPGSYDVYLYGHGTQAGYYGNYEVKVGSKSYGRKDTYDADNHGQDSRWMEGRQYVKFAGVEVPQDEDLEVLIRPGDEVTAEQGRKIRDAMIAGLQLIPCER